MLGLPDGFIFRFTQIIQCLIDRAIDDSDADCPPDYTFAGQLSRFLCLLGNFETKLE